MIVVAISIWIIIGIGILVVVLIIILIIALYCIYNSKLAAFYSYTRSQCIKLNNNNNYKQN